MPSKTSFFSKTIFIKNITRYWPLWAAYIVLCFVQLPIYLLTSFNVSSLAVDNVNLSKIQELQTTVEYTLYPIFYFIYACLLAIALFSYLFQAKSNYMIHSLPVRRESLYVTNIVSGLCFIIVPHILTFLCSIPACLFNGITELDYLFHWLILATGMTIFAFALAVLAVMITGNIIAAPVIYIIMNYIFVAFRTAISLLSEYLCFGLTSEVYWGDFLSPYFCLSYLSSGYNDIYYVETWEEFVFSLSKYYTHIGGYFIAGIVLFLVAFLIYKKKHLETSGDIISLSFLKPICRWLITIFCSISGSIALYMFLNPYDTYLYVQKEIPLGFIIPLILFIGIIVFFLSDMIIQKKFRVFSRKRLIECGIVMILLVGFTLGLEHNIYGQESYIPKAKDIASIDIDGEYNIHLENEDFSPALALHEDIIAAKNAIEAYYETHSYFIDPYYRSITYTLKNGSKITRYYEYPVDDAFSYLNDFWDNPEYFKRNLFTSDYENIRCTTGEISVFTDDYASEKIFFNAEQAQKLLEAYLKDTERDNYKCDTYYGLLFDEENTAYYRNILCLRYILPEGTKYYGEHSWTQSQSNGYTEVMAYIPLSTYDTNTLQVLQEYGIPSEGKRMISLKEYWDNYEEIKDNPASHKYYDESYYMNSNHY